MLSALGDLIKFYMTACLFSSSCAIFATYLEYHCFSFSRSCISSASRCNRASNSYLCFVCCNICRDSCCLSFPAVSPLMRTNGALAMVLPDNLRCNMPLFSSFYLNSYSLRFFGFLPRFFPKSLYMVFLFRLPGLRPRFFGGFYVDTGISEDYTGIWLSLGAVEAEL